MIFVGIFLAALFATVLLRRLVSGAWSAVMTWPWWLWLILIGGLVVGANLA